jgi:hypothetical protein
VDTDKDDVSEDVKRYCKSCFFFFFHSTPGILLTYQPGSYPRSPLSNQGRDLTSLLQDAEEEGKDILNKINPDLKRHCKSCFVLPLLSY